MQTVNPNSINFYIQYNVANDCVDLFAKTADGSVIQPVILEKVTEGELIHPFLRLKTDEAQILINKLWDVGFKPSGIKSAEAQVEAIKYHLEDMRKLVFE